MITSKKCNGCGFVNDTLLTNCICCKKPLPSVNIDEISNETLIMEGSKWIGCLTDRFVILEGGSIWQPIQITNGQVLGIAKQYLNLIKVRATSNELLQNVAYDLEKDIMINTKKSNNKDKMLIIFGIIFVCVIFLPTIILFLR